MKKEKKLKTSTDQDLKDLPKEDILALMRKDWDRMGRITLIGGWTCIGLFIFHVVFQIVANLSHDAMWIHVSRVFFTVLCISGIAGLLTWICLMLHVDSKWKEYHHLGPKNSGLMKQETRDLLKFTCMALSLSYIIMVGRLLIFDAQALMERPLLFWIYIFGLPYTIVLFLRMLRSKNHAK